jgi:hypothetical protein
MQSKYIDTQISAGAATSTGTITDLTNIGQGSDIADRVGDAVRIRKLTFNYEVSTQNADIYNSVRCIIFQWKINTNLASPTINDIMENASAFTTLSPYDWHMSDQFVIIYDKLSWLSGTASNPCSSGFQGRMGIIPLNVPYFRDRIEFNTGATTGSQKLYCLFYSDSAASPFPVVNFVCRTEFAED